MQQPEGRKMLAETPEAQAMRAQLGQILQSAMDQLPKSCRTGSVLQEVKNLNTAETVDFLGLSQKAVNTRLHRSRALWRRVQKDRAVWQFAEAYSLWEYAAIAVWRGS